MEPTKLTAGDKIREIIEIIGVSLFWSSIPVAIVCVCVGSFVPSATLFELFVVPMAMQMVGIVTAICAHPSSDEPRIAS